MLLYALIHAPNESALIKRAEASRGALPDVILNAPELLQGLALYYNGYIALGSCRLTQQSPIPWTAMRDYCEEYRIIGEQREYFYDMLKSMDVEYLGYVAKKLESSGKSKAPITNRGK